MANKKLIYEYLVEYLNDELPENIKEEYLKEIDSNLELAERFSTIVGKLQMSIQKLKLNENEIQHLHSFVADSEERAHSEMRSISNMEDLENYSNKRSKLLWIVGVLAVIAFVFFYFKPTKAPVFDPLQTLSYESLALEDDSQGRIYFPTEDIAEVKSYFDTDKTLGFTPTLLEKIDPSWKVTGASIMDYEIAKVLLVQYENLNLNEKLFHFILKGNYSLENKDEIQADSYSFYPYASDQINMLVWYSSNDNPEDRIVNIVASRRGIEELTTIIGKALNISMEYLPAPQPQQQPQQQRSAPVVKQQPVNNQVPVTEPPQKSSNTVTPAQKTDTEATSTTTEPEEEVSGQEEESVLQEGSSSESSLDIPIEDNTQE